jgi:uncharacterized phage-associated protein
MLEKTLLLYPMTDNQQIFLNSIVYIANRFNNRTVDFHKLSKVFYFAEQKHLVKYGSKLIDDEFIAMDKGPVPSSIYDLLKGLKRTPEMYPTELKNAFTINNYLITSKVEPDMDWLSQSEVSCIDEAIAEIGNLNFSELSDRSHDSAWKSDYYMKTEKIAKAGGANEDMIAYIRNSQEKTRY